MTLILEIAAGVVLGLFAYSILQVIFARVISEFKDIWDEAVSRPWVWWTLGITGAVLIVGWLLDDSLGHK